MNEDNSNTLSRSAFLLLPALALAFYVAFIPHQSYLYPVHLDEWIHLVNAEAILQTGSTTYINPLLDTASGIRTNLELGFQLFWGIFQRISGISWIDIFRYFPSIIYTFTALATYCCTRRLGFGWEAAIFAGLVPTTVGILGPAFLVPVATGLLFIPLAILVAFNFSNIWSYIVLFVFTCFLLAIHAPSAICLVIILFPYILLNLKGNFKHSFGLSVALVLPFLAPFPWIFGMLGPTAKLLLTPQSLPEFVDLPMIIKSYGYVPTGLCILGTFVLAFKGGRKNYGLALGLLAILAMLVTFFTFHYGISIMYERGLMFMMLMLGIIAGAGLMGIRQIALPGSGNLIPPVITRNLGNVLCAVIVAITLFISIPSLQKIPYYQIINNEDYDAFIWIKENLGKEYEKAVLDPWQGAPFIAITEKQVFSWIHASPKPSDLQARAFLESYCADTAFLKKNGISIVYAPRGCNNPDLTAVAKNVYVLRK